METEEDKNPHEETEEVAHRPWPTFYLNRYELWFWRFAIPLTLALAIITLVSQ